MKMNEALNESNDLNSVYMVGRVKDVEANDGSEFTIVNNSYSYDEKTKEYNQSSMTFYVKATGIPKKIKVGARVGINGRLDQRDGKFFIVANNVQLLEKPKADPDSPAN